MKKPALKQLYIPFCQAVIWLIIGTAIKHDIQCVFAAKQYQKLCMENPCWNRMSITYWLFFKSTYHIGYVKINLSFNLTIINHFKTRVKVNLQFTCTYTPWSGLACSWILDITDLQCKQKGKYTLNIDIVTFGTILLDFAFALAVWKQN